MTRENNMINTASGIALLAGIWLIIAPFVLNFSALGVSATNDVILGIVIGILALIRLTNHELVWPSWLNLILGLWLIISPFVLGFSGVAQVVWNDVIVGLVVGAAAITSGASTTVSPQM